MIDILNTEIVRREWLGGALAIPLGLFAAGCATGRESGVDVQTQDITILSPAPSGSPIHAVNLLFGEALAGISYLKISVEPVALPQAVNEPAQLPAAKRQKLWPIMTSVDLKPARAGSDSQLHGYPVAQPGLMFLARLYEVGFGIAVPGDGQVDPASLIGKRIGVPTKASSVRVMTDALLRDGWGIIDQVELIEMPPSQVLTALAEDAIDATSWVMMMPGTEGQAPMLPAPPTVSWQHIQVDDAVLDRINQANPFKMTTMAGPSGVRLLSFTQSLCAWNDSDPAAIGEVMERIELGCAVPGFVPGAKAMVDWPDLKREEIHSVAAAFYRVRGLLE